MSATRVFFPAGVQILSTYLGHVGSQQVDNQLQDLTVHPTGGAFPNLTGSKEWSPEAAVETPDIVAALALMTELNFCADLAAGNVDLYFREAKLRGMQESVADTAKHQVYRMQENAMLYWESLQCGQKDDFAKMQIKIAATWDGTNDPVQVPAGALPDAAAAPALFTLGPVYINGTLFDGETNLSWANNPEVVKTSASGEASPSHVCLRRVKPVITLQGCNLRAVSAWDRDGFAITNLTIYLRRRRPSKINWADNEAKHLRIVATAGSAKWKSTGGDPANATVEIHLHEATPGAGLMTVTPAVAITAPTGTTTTTTTTTTT